MSERRKVEERLRKKEQEIGALQEQIKDARIYIQALQDVLKMFPKTSDIGVAAGSVLRSGSSVAHAREAILARGQPLQILDLLQVLNKEPSRENRASLTSSLASYVRRGEIFTRPAPNTFGLIELGHDAAEEIVREPPPGFGEMSGIADVENPDEPVDEDDEQIPF